MSAREMFEKLGYKEFPNYETQVRFIKKEFGINVEIVFYLTNLMFFKDNSSNDIAVPINLKEFKAIQQQILELGWEE